MEIGAFSLNCLTYPWGFIGARPVQNNHPTQKQNPILLVHGYGLNRLSMCILSLYLKRKGYPWVWSINHPVLKDDITAFAKELDHKIQWYCHYTQSTDVTVIAHSMGGIVSTLAMKNHNSPISRLITLGTPWKGTKMHILGLGKQVSQMAPSHPIIQQLVPPSIPHLAIWSKQDWILLPTENAIRDNLNHTQIDHIGHLSLLISHRVFSTIHQFLQCDEAQSTDSLRHR
jgi:pimeloyl-ACP methyl ester carboxylesterase